MNNREIDRLVAIKLFGSDAPYRIASSVNLPYFTTDISHVWLVVDRMRELKYELVLNNGAYLHEMEWHACYRKAEDLKLVLPLEPTLVLIDNKLPDDPFKHLRAYSHSAPMAICLAALKALGAEVSA